MLSVLVNKVQASIFNFFLLDLRSPVNEDKTSCFKVNLFILSGDRKVLWLDVGWIFSGLYIDFLDLEWAKCSYLHDSAILNTSITHWRNKWLTFEMITSAFFTVIPTFRKTKEFIWRCSVTWSQVGEPSQELPLCDDFFMLSVMIP